MGAYGILRRARAAIDGAPLMEIGRSMTISVRQEDFKSIADEWECILPHTGANTIFITPWWQQLWWRRYGDADTRLEILSVRDGDSLLGIAPLMVKGDTLSFLGDTDLFDYHDLLVREGCEDAFYAAIWQSIEAMDWRTMELKSLRDSSETLRRFPALAEANDWSANISDEDVSPYTHLQPSWDEYVSGLRKKDRHELRRKLRRLNNGNEATQYAFQDAGEIADAMPEFFRLMRASRPDKDDFLTPDREQFFRELAKELSARQQFKLFFLELNDVRVAACICFDYNGDYLLYNSGYDPEYSSLSVGLLNKALCIQDAIESGKKTFDFLRGSERYKYNLGGTNQTIHELVIQRD